MAEILQYLPIVNPTWNFLVVLILILFAPMLFERLRIPSIVGLILAGILVGPYGFHILERDTSFELFGKVGLYYIMFLASLEMNLQSVRKDRAAALGFGLLTFGLPMLVGTLANWSLLGYGLVAAVLMAAMYASHTLLAYPIVMRFGLTQRRSVNLAVGGTIVADTLTLLVLAVIGGMFKEGVHGPYWLWLVLKVIALGILIVITFPRLCRWFFRKVDDGVVQYIFVLLLVFLGAGLMETVGMEGILGAFLVGIVLNRTIPASSPLMSHIEFVGNALFIPYFLIGVGMIINLRVIFGSLHGFGVALGMVVIATFCKWLAARTGQAVFHLRRADGHLLFGLTGARAAATLAIMLVGSRIVLPDGTPLFDDAVVGGTMLLILVSCIISPMLTDRAARHIMLTTATQADDAPQSRRLLVGINATLGNSKGEDENSQLSTANSQLVHAALMLATPHESPMSLVSVMTDDSPELRQEVQKALARAARIAAEANVEVHTQSRLSVNRVTGLTYSVKELDATDILISLHRKQRISENFYGRFAPDLIAATSQQIILYRSLIPINTLRRIHLVVPRKAEHEPGFHQWADRVAAMAEKLAIGMDIYSGHDTLEALRLYWRRTHRQVYADYVNYSSFQNFQPMAAATRQDHIVIIVAARPGMPSHEAAYLSHLPEQLERYFSTRSLMIIYPSSHGDAESRPKVLAIS